MNDTLTTLMDLLTPGHNIEIKPVNGKIQISVPVVGDFTVGDNIGVGTGSLYAGKQGTVLRLRRLSSESEHLGIRTEGDQIIFNLPDPGEINTGRNLGKGTPVYQSNVGPELTFRSLLGSDSINVTARPTGEIQFDLGRDLNILGSLTLPAEYSSEVKPARIRYNPTLDCYEVTLGQNWVRLSTDSGTFLPLIGGDLNGHLNLDAGASLRNGDLILDGAKIVSGPKGMEINLGDSGKIVSGLQGTIDGYRIPDLGAFISDLRKIPSGLVYRDQSGDFISVGLISDQNHISLTQSETQFELGLAENIRFPGTASIQLPSGPDGTRDARIGAIRYNSAGHFEVCYPSGWESLTSTNQGTFSEIRVQGDIHVGGKLNGFDLHDLTDRYVSLSQIRGLVYSGDYGLSGARIMVDELNPGIRISDLGDQIRIGLDQTYLSTAINNALSGQNLVRSEGGLIEGRNLIEDGKLIDKLNQLEPGLLGTSGSGELVSRLVLPSALPEALGLSVDRGDASGNLTLGLRLAGLPEVTTAGPDDFLVLSTAQGNVKISLSNLVKALASLQPTP